jgi:putative sugar O-methyltransferase
MGLLDEILRKSSQTAARLRGDNGILEVARSHYVASPRSSGALPSFGIRWGQLRDELEETIGKFKSPVEAIDFGLSRGIYDHRERLTAASIPKIKTAQHLLQYEYPEFWAQIYLLKETRAATPGYGIKVRAPWGGKVFVSDILYFHAFHVLTCLRYRGDLDSICEVGGGYGNPALQWLTNPIKPVTRYCIVDMPESLFFAEVFLRSALPDMRIHYATEREPATDSPGITLVPVQLSAQTKNASFDLVTNTGSMAEMTDEWLNYWCNWLDQQNTKLFYSHNLIGNAPDVACEAPTVMAPVVVPTWRPVYVRPMHPMMLLHSKGRIASEIIFERTATVDRHDVSKAITFFDGTKLRLENYIYFLYAILRELETNRPYIMEFAQRIIKDFGYAPVELIFLLNHGDQNNQELVRLRDELGRRADAKYEEMTTATEHAILGITKR